MGRVMVKSLLLFVAVLAAALGVWIATDADIPVPTPSGWIVIGAPRMEPPKVTPPSAYALQAFRAYTSGQGYLVVASPEAIVGPLEQVSAECLAALDARAHEFGGTPIDLAERMPKLPAVADDRCHAAENSDLRDKDLGLITKWAEARGPFGGQFRLLGFQSGAWMSPAVRKACSAHVEPRRLNLDYIPSGSRLWCG